MKKLLQPLFLSITLLLLASNHLFSQCVGDVTLPVATCTNVTAYIGAAGTVTIDSNATDNGSTDNCGIQTIALSQETFTCAEVGTVVAVTMTVTDTAGNFATCMANVTVSDTTSPTASCQDITVFLDGAGTASIVASDIDNGSTDNCTTVSLAADITAFTCADLGANTVTLTVTDGSGNTSMCTSTVTVSDTTSPTASCQDITVFLDGAGTASIVASDIDNGSTDNCTTVSLAADIIAFTCADLGANTVTLTVTDGSANTSMCTSTVTVLDTINPVITCKDTTVYLDAMGMVSFDTSYVVASITDNCGVDSVWMSHDSAICTDDTLNYTIYARDSSGNIDSCENIIIVLDTINPVITCKDTTVYLDAMGMVSFDTSYVVTSITDNCGVDSVWMSHDSAICTDDTLNYTIYARDNSGNIDSCENMIIVLDTLNPIIVCNDTTVYLDAMGMVSFDTSYVVTSITDNCGVDSVWMSHDSAICTDDTVNYTIYARDNSGNIDSCENMIIVLDTINPVITCKDTTVYLDAMGMVSFDTSYVVTGYSDNCGVDSVWMSHDSATCAEDTVNYTIYARDSSGNIDSCESMIIVLDTIAPVVVCKDTTVYLDGTGMVSFDTSYVVTSITENCGIDSVWMSHNSATCADDTIKYTVYVIDNSGNIDSCENDIIVLDTLNSKIVCKDTIVYLDAMGMVSFDTSYVVVGVSCKVDSIWMSHDSATCADDTINYTVYARDNLGNIDSCENIIIVLDTINPVITCKDTTVYLDAMGMVSFDTSYVVTGYSDNCGVDSVWMSQDSATCADDTLNYTLYARDSSGNIDSCENIIIVLDTINPVITCKDTTVYLDAMGMVSFDTSYVVTSITDNCGVDSVWMSHDSAICTDDTLNYTIYARDNSGNIDSCENIIIVLDTLNPIIVCNDTTVYLDAMGMVSFDTSYVVTSITDNCGVDSVWMSHDSAICTDDTVNYTIYARDNSGNIDSCENIIIVLDTINPVITCKDTTVYLDAMGMVSFDTSYVVTGYSDNCGVDSVWMSQDSATCADDTLNYTLYARDSSGNIDSCESMIIVLDTINPVITCKDTTVYLDAMGMVSFDTSYVVTSITDNCGVDSVWMSHDSAICTDDTLNYTIYARDNSGNIDSCENMIIVLDTLNPIIVCKDTTVYLDAMGMVSFDTSYVVTSITDNCGVDSVWMSHDSAICTDDTLNYTLYARDNSGNIDSCENMIIVLDTLNPIIVCNDTTVYLDAMGMVSFDTSYVVTSITDNCGVDSVWMSQDSATCADDTLNYTLYARDNSGNIDSCENMIIVLDTIAPVVVCKDTTLYLDKNNLIQIDTSYVMSSVFDNCGVDSVWLSQTDFTCLDLGTNAVSVIARDSSGNIDSCIATVTIAVSLTIDTIAVQLDQSSLGNICLTQSELIGGTYNASYSIIPAYGLMTNYNDTCFTYNQTSATKYLDTAAVIVCDDCGICDTTVLIFVPTPDPDTLYVGPVIPVTNVDTCVVLESSYMTGHHVGTCDSTGTSIGGVPVTITGLCVRYPVPSPVYTGDTVCIIVCDTIRNITICDTTLIVYLPDTTPPTVICKNDTVYLDNLGTVTIDTSNVLSSVTDNTLVNAVWLTPSTFNCANVGPNNVSVYARDTNRNMDSCQSIVTVLDTILPTAVCRNITILLDSNGNASILAIDVDGGSTDNCAIASIVINKSSFDCSNLGANTVTLTVTDVYGNSSSCTSTVTVEDNIAPIAYCPGDKQRLIENTNCSYIVEDFTSETSTWDNCSSGSGVTITQLPLAGTEVFLENASQLITITATDGSGNTSSCSFNVYARCVKELNIPQFISPDGSGQNDTWEIPELANYPNNTVKVFNRWGNLVMEEKGYFTGWNGSSNVDRGANRLLDNKMLPEGTYFYIIDLGTNDIEPYVGYLQIKR